MKSAAVNLGENVWQANNAMTTVKVNEQMMIRLHLPLVLFFICIFFMHRTYWGHCKRLEYSFFPILIRILLFHIGIHSLATLPPYHRRIEQFLWVANYYYFALKRQFIVKHTCTQNTRTIHIVLWFCASVSETTNRANAVEIIACVTFIYSLFVGRPKIKRELINEICTKRYKDAGGYDQK